MNQPTNPTIPPDDLVSVCEDDVRFFRNPGKEDRERWVFDNWCRLTGRDSTQASKGEAPDFTLGSEQIEIVEVMAKGRKRHDETKKALASAKAHPPELVIHDGSELKTVRRKADGWLRKTIEAKEAHYGPSAQDWILLIYVNFDFVAQTDWAAVRSDLSSRTSVFSRMEVLMPDGQSHIVVYPHP
jgi:hypothetical protein